MRGFGNSRLARESVQSQSLEKASYNNQVLVLSENDAQKFVEMMVNPPKPSSALIARQLKRDRRICVFFVAMKCTFQYPSLIN